MALSVGFGSSTAPVTDQPTGWSPRVTPVSRAVISTLAPGGTVPRSHWGEPAPQLPDAVVSSSSRTPGGASAVNVVRGEGEGPRLTTVTVTSTEEPTSTAGPVGGAVTARSTDCW